MGMATPVRHRMAARAAEEIMEGMVVNLGIGIPSLVPDHLPPGYPVIFHAENGILGMGPSPEPGMEDANLCNAGGYPVTLQPGGSYCDSAAAFGIIRAGMIDITILGALQVSEAGDLANWIVPGRRVPGMGGAMELAQGAKKVIVLMNHTDRSGAPKLVDTCTLPLTAKRCVDVIITEMGVFACTKNGLVLTDLFEPFSIEEIKAHTSAAWTPAGEIRLIPEETKGGNE